MEPTHRLIIGFQRDGLEIFTNEEEAERVFKLCTTDENVIVIANGVTSRGTKTKSAFNSGIVACISLVELPTEEEFRGPVAPGQFHP